MHSDAYMLHILDVSLDTDLSEDGLILMNDYPLLHTQASTIL